MGTWGWRIWYSLQMARPSHRCKVAFDTSVLGYAQYGAGGRTGVFRMADSLARELTRQPTIDLSFCGAENFEMWTHARRYLEQDEEFRHVPVLSYQSTARVYGFLGRWFSSLAKEQEISVPARAVRRALKESLRLLADNSLPLKPTDLSGFDIYHSLFYPLPEVTRSVPGLRRYLSVCDLINIQHPRFSNDGGAFLKTILASLMPQDRVIAISECTKADLCNYRADIDPNLVFVVPLAASKAFQPVEDVARTRSMRSRYGLGRNYFLSVCTLDKRKNIDGLVSAFAQWVHQEKTHDVDLVLCGGLGESTVVIREKIRESGLSAQRVKILGYVPDVDLAPLYSAALGFIYPSFYEGFGLPVLEAMQCGTPVVTSKGSALEEVASGATLLVDPNSQDELSSALDRLYRNPNTREQYAQLGRERASKYSWTESTRLLVKAYQAP